MLVTHAEGDPVMSRLAIALVLALAATAANAEATKSEQSQTPAVANANGARPFLFDGRMKGDGDRRRALIDDHRSNSGAIVMPPKASKPASEH
jgi:predicted lipoprotein with Yx(FWY)xxD motif